VTLVNSKAELRFVLDRADWLPAYTRRQLRDQVWRPTSTSNHTKAPVLMFAHIIPSMDVHQHMVTEWVGGGVGSKRRDSTRKGSSL
jgi:hypothetical protein